MAVKIRLKRMGKKRNAFFRLVVADSRMPRDGRFIEELGYYDPTTDPETVKINEDLALRWMEKGAKPSNTVKNIFSRQGLMEKFHQLKQAR